MIDKTTVKDAEVIKILESLEKAVANNDDFAISVLLKRLENKKVTLIGDNGCKFGYVPVQ